MEQRLTLVTLGVADLERSRAFYERGLGWRRADAGSGDEIAFYDAGGVALALFPRDALADDAGVGAAGTGFPGFTLAHNVRGREEVEGVLARAEEAGGRIVTPAREAPWGGFAGYFADPDGFLWEVCWNPVMPLGPDGRMALPPPISAET